MTKLRLQALIEYGTVDNDTTATELHFTCLKWVKNLCLTS